MALSHTAILTSNRMQLKSNMKAPSESFEKIIQQEYTDIPAKNKQRELLLPVATDHKNLKAVNRLLSKDMHAHHATSQS